jgi:hypothetical protein
MFLRKILDLQLMDDEPDTNILATFPLDVKSILVSKINQSIIDTNIEKNLTSQAHVKLVMEVIGQGFDLPLDTSNIKTMAASVQIYSKWLLDPTKRPDVIINAGEASEMYQKFVQSIIKHCSLIFRPRIPIGPSKTEENTDLINQPSELCLKIFLLFSEFFTNHLSKWSEETWNVILRVLVGICDIVFEKKNAASKKISNITGNKLNQTIITDRLCETAIKVIIFNKVTLDVWKESIIATSSMWDILEVL